jgi:hypothetical protein
MRMKGDTDERRDRRLRMWHPGPRRGELKEVGPAQKFRHVVYRKLNAETGLFESVDSLLADILRSPHHTVHTVVGYPYAYRELPRDASRVMVAGGAHSAFAYTLASLGYETHVVDLLGYNLSHPNLSVHFGDIKNLPFDDDTFDYVVSNFVIGGIWDGDDHDVYPEEPAVREFSRVISTDGTVVISEICGRQPGSLPWRIYTVEAFRELVGSHFAIQNEELFARSGETWAPCVPETLPRPDGRRTAQGVISVSLSIDR